MKNRMNSVHKAATDNQASGEAWPTVGRMAQPARISWKEGIAYTCPEMQHRSSRVVHPSLISGQRVLPRSAAAEESE